MQNNGGRDLEYTENNKRSGPEARKSRRVHNTVFKTRRARLKSTA